MTNYKANRKSVVMGLALIMMCTLIVATPIQAKRIVENRIGFLKTVAIDTDGFITDEVIDTLEFDTANGATPNIIHVSGNIYAIAYTDDRDDGYLKTVEITTGGTITDTGYTLEFDTVMGLYPNIIHVSGEVYAIAYQGKGNDGFLKTVEIATDGYITDTVIDTLEFDSVVATTPNIIPVSDTVYVIAYWGEYGDGFLKTVEIAAGGEITDAVIDTLEFDTVMGLYPNIIQVSDLGNIYAIAYAGIYEYGYLKTVKIAADGQINDAVIDTLEFDSDIGTTPNIIQVSVSGNIYAIAYEGTSGDGFLKTVEIDALGNIIGTVNTLEFDTANGATPNIIQVSDSGNIYVIAYEGPSGDGFLKTVTIAPDGDIGAVINTLEFDTANGATPNIIQVSDDIYAIAYTQVSEE